jgi:hypothetical protein
MWPTYSAEIHRSFAAVLSDEEATILRDLLARVHAATTASEPAPAT